MSEPGAAPKEPSQGQLPEKLKVELTPFYRFIDDVDSACPSPGKLYTIKMLKEANLLLDLANKYNYLQYLKRVTPQLEDIHAEGAQNKSGEVDVVWIALVEMVSRQFSHLIPDIPDEARYAEHLQRLYARVKERTVELEQELKDFGPAKTYHAMDIYGQMQQRTIPILSDRGRYILDISSYADLATDFRKKVGEDGNAGYLTMYNLQAVPESDHSKWQACDSIDGIWQHWDDTWTKGTPHSELGSWKLIMPSDDMPTKYIAFGWKPWPQMTEEERETVKRAEANWASAWEKLSIKLAALVEKHRNQLKNVDQVVCFALGAISHQHPTSFVQHLAARTVRDALSQLDKTTSGSKSIDMIAQDPAYCPRCRVVLQDQLGINTVTNLDGFLKLTKNTFVISLAPSAPVLQIVADLLHDVGGPAAVLCDAFDDDYMRPERDAEYDWLSDEPTKNLVEYKRNCHVEHFGDAMQVLGMSWDGFKKTYPLVPVQQKRKLETENTKLTRNVTTYVRKCAEAHALAGKVHFRDTMMYVRR